MKCGDCLKCLVNVSFWMIWCVVMFECVNGDGIGDIKNVDARG